MGGGGRGGGWVEEGFYLGSFELGTGCNMTVNIAEKSLNMIEQRLSCTNCTTKFLISIPKEIIRMSRHPD